MRVAVWRTVLGVVIRRSNRLAESTIELGRHGALSVEHRVGRDKRLALLVHRSEDAFLLKSLAVCAAAVFGLVKSRASDLLYG